MKSISLVASLALFACVAFAADGEDFCYSDTDGCGPDSDAWPELCHVGKRQSPIQLPAKIKRAGLTSLRMIGRYSGSSFRMQNNGHSVAIDFVGKSGHNEGPTGGIFPFPDPLSVNHIGFPQRNVRYYRFASAHFHWGKNDSIGSEHCVGNSCAALELHLVHYLADYNSMAEAVNSGDENALTVLGVMANINVLSSLLGAITGKGHPSLIPIVNNLDKIANASHDAGFITINEPLDLTAFILTPDPQVYSYKGSLTTPGCNEQVNWFVVKRAQALTHIDLQAFRSKLDDSRGMKLNDNHRPLMPLNDRQVFLSTLLPSI